MARADFTGKRRTITVGGNRDPLLITIVDHWDWKEATLVQLYPGDACDIKNIDDPSTFVVDVINDGDDKVVFL